MARPQHDAAQGVRPVQIVPVEPAPEGGEMTTTIIDKALRRAEEAFPDSDYVASVREWFNEKGFITEAQEEALAKIADR